MDILHHYLMADLHASPYNRETPLLPRQGAAVVAVKGGSQTPLSQTMLSLI